MSAEYNMLSSEAKTALQKEFMTQIESWTFYDTWLEGHGFRHSDWTLRWYCEGLESFFRWIDE